MLKPEKNSGGACDKEVRGQGRSSKLLYGCWNMMCGYFAWVSAAQICLHVPHSHTFIRGCWSSSGVYETVIVWIIARSSEHDDVKTATTQTRSNTSVCSQTHLCLWSNRAAAPSCPWDRCRGEKCCIDFNRLWLFARRRHLRGSSSNTNGAQTSSRRGPLTPRC